MARKKYNNTNNHGCLYWITIGWLFEVYKIIFIILSWTVVGLFALISTIFEEKKITKNVNRRNKDNKVIHDVTMNLVNLKQLIDEFFQYAESEEIEIYNEFSLQHELVVFLRVQLPDYKVQFEKNISYFSSNNNTIKKEIDITIFNEDKSEKYAIELKYPRNGQYPEQMYSFVKDIKFTEELVNLGFKSAATVALVGERPFYEGRDNKGIYKYFREEYAVYGKIYKPTGATRGSDFIELNDFYEFAWKSTYDNRKYFIIEI